MRSAKVYFYNAFIKFMKGIYLHLFVIGIFVLFCSSLIITWPGPDCSFTKLEHISAISQDNSVSHDLEVLDLNSENSEVHNRIFIAEIKVSSKNLNYSRFNKHCLFSNVQNQLRIPVILKFLTYQQFSIISKGVLLI